MADEQIPDPTKTPNLRGQGAQTAAGWIDTLDLVGGSKQVAVYVGDALSFAIKIVLKGSAKFGAYLAGVLAKAEDGASPEFGELAAAAVSDLFGVPNPGGAAMTRGNRGGRTGPANDVGDMLFKAFAGAAGAIEGGELAPTDAPAKAFLATMTQLALEGWLEGWIVEACTLGQVEQFGELDDIISHVLGLGRASASVHGPLVRHLIVTPLEWKILKDHRPSLLTPSLAARQYLRGKFTRAELDEELGRQGWHPKRIDALLFDAAKQIGVSEISDMIAEGLLDQESALPYLKALGYSDDLAQLWGTIDTFHRRRVIRDNIVPLATRAYADREIDGVDLDNALEYAYPNIEERHEARVHAEHARSYNVKHLSHGEIKEAVERNILSTPDYREWLEREGYAPQDALVLELLLDSQLRGQQEAAKKKADAEAARAAEKAKRDAAAAARAAELEAKKARAGAPLGDVERAVVVGILPIEVYEARLRDLNFPAGDVAFEVELLKQRREDYLAAQERARLAKGPESPKTIALGALERAVVRGLASIEDYAARLQADNYDAGDAGVMIALVRDARADWVRAEEARAKAAAELTRRGLSLGQVEKSVRQGLLSLGDYQAWLVGQGFEPSDAALLRASLDQDLRDAAAAAERRAAVNAAAQSKGVSLAQLERAVKLGARSREDYQSKLIALAVSPDDQVTLLGILDAELAQLDDARRRREAPAPAPAPAGLTRADVEKAVRAGVLPIGAYRDYLAGAGYSVDDVEVLTALLALEVQDLALARQRRDQVDAGDQVRQLARADIERAVRRGIRTMGDYETFVAAAGYADDDQQLLVALLAAELAAKDTARQRHDKIAGELAGAGVDLAVLDAAAIAGELTLDDYVQQLARAGVKAADIGLLVQLVIEPPGDA
jgi:hypothetical protein